MGLTRLCLLLFLDDLQAEEEAELGSGDDEGDKRTIMPGLFFFLIIIYLF